MFNKVPTVLRSKEIIDKCFSRAARITAPEGINRTQGAKTQCIDKVSTVESIAVAYLKKLVRKFPSTDHLHPFYLDLLDMSFDIDAYKMSLGKLQWSHEKLVELATKSIKSLKRKQKIRDMNTVVREYYGRFASVIEDLSSDLEMLSRCRDQMKRIPEIDVNLPTFLIAGMPNVGKSSLVASLSTARPRVASFPFTTKNISIGYLQIGHEKVQVIDTPGVLDRPMTDRNEMEKKAISALNKIDGKILFLFDYSDTSGYTTESQEALYREVVEASGKDIIRIQTKIDMSQGAREDIAISSVTGEGLGDLKERLAGLLEVKTS
ncbi:MAG: 50S ribosome-binding GTPase [Candidatus Thermoplasmatota archaeon]|nr:50S ribosome-binding GTPase [Candidatus Thermoplasmatota archaeon]